MRLGMRPKYIHCAEDDEFVAELERMTAEAIMPACTGLSGGGGATATGSSLSTLGGGVGSVLPSLESLGVGAAAARRAAARSAAAQSQSAADNIIAALESKGLNAGASTNNLVSAISSFSHDHSFLKK